MPKTAHTRTKCIFRAVFAALLAYVALFQPNAALAEPITVRHLEGLTHGFLVLRALDGAAIADGDLTQVVKGDRVTDRLTFHFKDGSLSDETWVFTQRGTFRLVTDHLVQKGPAFKQPMETTLDVPTGQVTVRYTDDGKEKVLNQHLNLPPDLANGMIPILLKNIRPGAAKTTVSMLVATPKPRLVKLVITPASEESFSTGGTNRKATRYLVKIEIGGAAGLIAPIIGQQPPDTSVWILEGGAPAFLKSEGPQFQGGPIWQVELVSPSWPNPPSQSPTLNSSQK